MGLTRSSYLKAMGIDVWISQSAVAAQVVVDVEPTVKPANSQSGMPARAIAETAERVKQTKPEALVQASATAAVQDVPEFMLALFNYETIGLCLSLHTESDLPRRFCDDVARAMGGNIESVRYQLLKWPMLSTSGIDQSINAAREVVTQKFRQMPSRVLVFGDDVGDYYNPLRDLVPMTVGVVGPQTFLKVPSLKDLLGSGSAKRELMITMHHWLSSEMS